MTTHFSAQYIQQQNSADFAGLDPDLSKLKDLRYTYSSSLLLQLPIDVSGIYTLTGGVLTGKTTLLKQWIAKLLADGIDRKMISFYSGQMIKTHQVLVHLLQENFSHKKSGIRRYIIIDDVTYTPDWDNAIKFAAKCGWLENVVLMLSSSHKSLSKLSQTIFIHHTSNISKRHFQLYPLTFRETILLKHPEKKLPIQQLFHEFDHYLLHGGFLPAINDFEMHGKILESTFKHYSDALQNEMIKHGKQALFLRDILTGIINNYTRQITWNKLSQELSIDHPSTIGDYVSLLESLDTVFIQAALLENSLTPAPKKARKLMFTDPFIYHAINAYLFPEKNVFKSDVTLVLNNADLYAKLACACVTTHFRRHYPTYYIKSAGENDLAYIHQQRFWPILITWTNQIRAKDLKQLLKYRNGKILTKTMQSGMIDHIRTEPLPKALIRLGK